MTEIFLTGAVGQLGTALAAKLVQAGYKPICFIHTLEDQTYIPYLKSLGINKIYTGDLRKPEKFLHYISEGSIILHCYSLSPGANQTQEIYDVHNYQISKNLLEAARQKNVKQFVYIGTCSVIGPKATKKHYLAESDPVGPDEPYGKSKLAVEQEIKTFHAQTNIHCLILRVFPIYGPHAHINASPLRLCKLLQKKYFFIIGSGKNHYEFGFTKNIAEGIVTAIKKIPTGLETIHIVEKQKRTYLEIVQELAKYVNPKVKFIHIPTPLAIVTGYIGDILTYLFHKRFIFRTRSVNGLRGGWNANPQKMISLLGDTQKYTMEQGIQEFMMWVKEKKMLQQEWQKPKSYL